MLVATRLSQLLGREVWRSAVTFRETDQINTAPSQIGGRGGDSSHAICTISISWWTGKRLCQSRSII